MDSYFDKNASELANQYEPEINPIEWIPTNVQFISIPQTVTSAGCLFCCCCFFLLTLCNLKFHIMGHDDVNKRQLNTLPLAVRWVANLLTIISFLILHLRVMEAGETNNFNTVGKAESNFPGSIGPLFSWQSWPLKKGGWVVCFRHIVAIYNFQENDLLPFFSSFLLRLTLSWVK